VAAYDRYRLSADAWLSGVLGRPAWAVSPEGATPLSELHKPGAQFATAKLDASDTEAAVALQVFGFRVVDTALTLELASPAPGKHPAGVRFARPEDRPAVEAIAGSAFRYSRFHLDPQIPKSLADRVKTVWAGNWFSGQRGDAMVVAEDGGKVAGFLQLIWAGEQWLVIDLIAVRPQSARQGLARGMIAFAQANGTGDARRPSGMVVGTQAANAPSVRLYESLGFRLQQARFVLHHHGVAA
jgi:ribosomal protein S18 acetylase RimI-like enzyme